MTSRLRLISAIVAAIAALGASSSALSAPPDAQSRAAALLSGVHAHGAPQTHEQADAPSSAPSGDAHAKAAALLAGNAAPGQATASVLVSSSSSLVTQRDAHAQAAALLRGSPSIDERQRITATDELSNEHPAVLVSRAYRMRGIDPNQFIVMHPAGLQLSAASPTE